MVNKYVYLVVCIISFLTIIYATTPIFGTETDYNTWKAKDIIHVVFWTAIFSITFIYTLKAFKKKK